MKNYQLKRFNPETATNEEFEARLEFLNNIRAEERPEMPAISLDSLIKNAKARLIQEDRRIEIWSLWHEKKIIAGIRIIITNHDENKHLIEGTVTVLKEYRRRGIATYLLKKVLEIAKENNRSLLISWSTSRVPAGQSFADKFDAELAMESHVNRLSLAKLDKKLMNNWITQAQNKASDFEIGFWLKGYPEDEIVDIAKMMEVMNTAPIDDLDINDEEVTPEQLRDREQSMQMTGTEYWLCYVRHKESRELAGYTDTFWNLDDPKTVHQGDTGVLPKYRGHGLGKWLKAAMVEKILEDRPDVKYINTGNADSNVHMLAINKAMGFEPYIAEQIWQIRLEQLEEYFSNTKTN